MNPRPRAPDPGAALPDVQAALQRAVAHHQAGRLRDAEALYRQILQGEPRHADALHLLGVVALQGGDFDAACDLIAMAIQVRPADNYYCNLGNALKARGRRAAAIASYRQALALNGRMVEALANLGVVLLDDGQVDEAVACCAQAVALRPQSAEAHCNLGNALLQQGRLQQAVASYRQALQIQPRLALAHANLGRALAAADQPAQALDSCRQALACGPPSAELHSRMGSLHRRLGQLEQAIDNHLQALRLGDGDAVRRAFVQAIKDVHFHAPHAELRAQLVRALDEGWADPADLLTPAVSLVEANPAIHQAIVLAHRAAVDAGVDDSGARLGPGLLHDIAADALLRSLLGREAINSIALERLLTLLRRQMLDAAWASARVAAHPPDRAAPVDLPEGLRCDLARQCFINDYVYACSAAEVQQLGDLRTRLAACHADGMLPDARWVVACAAYAPLGDLPGADTWAGHAWPAPLAALFVQQCSEPALEWRHRATIDRLTAIDDPLSCQVRAQYEAHPYPRWLFAPQPVAAPDIDSLLRRQCPGAPWQPVASDGPPQVLVAGCGTGQHAIHVARQLPDARVLAVDLSLASLAYARRKTDELALDRIDYAQADILQLGALDQRFDLIEAAGVLHHMADPLAGWQVLRGLLRPRGLMFIGLYSELGRRDVVAARQRLATAGLPAEAAAIRACRQQLMADGLAPQFADFLASRDFYTTSACRDLLFHVHEQRFSLPHIGRMLAALGLRFIGFQLDADVLATYTRQFPDDPARVDLDRWHCFETERPQTFSRMYQFWVQAQ